LSAACYNFACVYNPKPNLIKSVISESILNALTQLYALAANATGTSSQGRMLAQALLKEQLNAWLVTDYLGLY